MRVWSRRVNAPTAIAHRLPLRRRSTSMYRSASCCAPSSTPPAPAVFARVAVGKVTVIAILGCTSRPWHCRRRVSDVPDARYAHAFPRCTPSHLSRRGSSTPRACAARPRRMALVTRRARDGIHTSRLGTYRSACRRSCRRTLSHWSQHEHGGVLESRCDQWDNVQRRERLHAERYVPRRDVHRRESRHVHGE